MIGKDEFVINLLYKKKWKKHGKHGLVFKNLYFEYNEEVDMNVCNVSNQ